MGRGPTNGINGSFVSPEKKFTINFSKARTNSAWPWIIMVIIIIGLLMDKKSIKLKSIMETSTFQVTFI